MDEFTFIYFMAFLLGLWLGTTVTTLIYVICEGDE